jgi:pimeloyl-ACP methyl ester carboxylesterase
MDGSGSLFSDFSSALGAKAIVVSYPPDKPFGYRQLQDFVRNVLPMEEPFILVGESFSGPIAISLAASPLPTLRALVMVCTFAKMPGSRLPTIVSKLVSYLPVWHAPIRLQASVLLGRHASRTWRYRLSAAMKDVTSCVWRTRIRSALTVDVTSDLAQILLPMLYIRATKDRVVFRSASKVISRINPRVKVVDIDGPHFLLQAKPREAATAVNAFMQEIGVVL